MKDIPGYEGRYAATEDGRIWSHVTKKFLSPRNRPDGHLQVQFPGKAWYIHHLVLMTFGRPRPEGFEARHLNGVPGDNHISNLEWSTRTRNIQDKKWHCGTRTQKLTGAQASELKRRLLAGESRRALAQQFGVGKTTCDKIVWGVMHRDV